MQYTKPGVDVLYSRNSSTVDIVVLTTIQLFDKLFWSFCSHSTDFLRYNFSYSILKFKAEDQYLSLGICWTVWGLIIHPSQIIQEKVFIIWANELFCLCWEKFGSIKHHHFNCEVCFLRVVVIIIHYSCLLSFSDRFVIKKIFFLLVVIYIQGFGHILLFMD